MKTHPLLAFLILLVWCVLPVRGQNTTVVRPVDGLVSTNSHTTGVVYLGLDGFAGASAGMIPSKSGATITWAAASTFTGTNAFFLATGVGGRGFISEGAAASTVTNKFGKSGVFTKNIYVNTNSALNSTPDVQMFYANDGTTLLGQIGTRTAGTPAAGMTFMAGDGATVGDPTFALQKANGFSITMAGANGGVFSADTAGLFTFDSNAGAGKIKVTGTSMHLGATTVSNTFLVTGNTTVDGVLYPTADGASNSVFTTYGNGTSAFLPLPSSSGQVTTNGFNLYSLTSTNVMPGVTVSGTNGALSLLTMTNYGCIIAPQPNRATGSLLIWGNNAASTAISQLSIGIDSRQILEGTSNFTFIVYNGTKAEILSGTGQSLGLYAANGQGSIVMSAAGAIDQSGAGAASIGGSGLTINSTTMTVNKPMTCTNTASFGPSPTAIVGIPTVSTTVDAPSISAQASWSTNLALTPAKVGAACAVRRASSTSGILYAAFCTNAGEVCIELNNYTAAPIDPASQTIGATLIDY